MGEEEKDLVLDFGGQKVMLSDAIEYVTKQTKELVILKQEGQRILKVFHIPLILYGEISERFGIGEEIKGVSALGGSYQLVRRLNSDNPKIGFPGAIGI